jgi:hypothetical protein
MLEEEKFLLTPSVLLRLKEYGGGGERAGENIYLSTGQSN